MGRGLRGVGRPGETEADASGRFTDIVVSLCSRKSRYKWRIRYFPSACWWDSQRVEAAVVTGADWC